MSKEMARTPLESGWETLGGKNSAHNERKAEKAFCFFELVEKSSQNTELRETIEMYPVKVCLSNLLSTHLIKDTEKLYTGYKKDSG